MAVRARLELGHGAAGNGVAELFGRSLALKHCFGGARAHRDAIHADEHEPRRADGTGVVQCGDGRNSNEIGEPD